jgi:hypothetical protein
MAKKEKKYDDIAVVLAFPDNWAKGERLRDRLLYKLRIIYTQYYKVGHAALLLIERRTGTVEYFDFGRYITPQKRGRVRSRDTDPKLAIPIKAEFDHSGDIRNLLEIMTYLESISDATHGSGRTFFSERRHIDFRLAKKYINRLISKGSILYISIGPVGMNCASFVLRTLLKSAKASLSLWKLYFPETLSPSPIGNVVNSSSKGQIWKMYKGEFEKQHWNRFKVRRFIFNNLMLSRNKEQILKEKVNEMGVVQKRVPKALTEKAQFVYGLGESAWMHIHPGRFCAPDQYIIDSFTTDGQHNYSIIAELREGKFDIEEPYEFTHDCIRLKSTLVQNGRKLIFDLVREHPIQEKVASIQKRREII